MQSEMFVIGDVQGQAFLLKRLLQKAGLMSVLGTRLRPEVMVLQLGDLGHFARYRMGTQLMTPEDDAECFRLLEIGILDQMLWGNHERPMMRHLRREQIFGGYVAPDLAFIEKIEAWRQNGKITLAFANGDWLFTHAGLHAAWGQCHDLTDASAIAEALNNHDRWLFDHYEADEKRGLDVSAFVDTIGVDRGGYNDWGGILWRDAEEALFEAENLRQVFGHTASREVQKGHSYCLDISKNDSIAGLWLPSEEILTVSLDG